MRRYYLIFSNTFLFLILFNFIIFTINIEHNNIFWLNYIFTTICICLQIPLALRIIHTKLQLGFYRYSIFIIYSIYFCLQIILCFIGMFCAWIEEWQILLADGVLLLICLIIITCLEAYYSYILSLETKNDLEDKS